MCVYTVHESLHISLLFSEHLNQGTEEVKDKKYTRKILKPPAILMESHLT